MKTDTKKKEPKTVLELKASTSTKGRSGPNPEGSGFAPVQGGGK
jgi:hypothetical protein